VNTNKHIRLTRPVTSQCGWLWSRLPITAANYRIELEFKITGAASHLYGDGMALWLTTTRATAGPVFCSVDQWDGLGIFIDTYANAQHSYAFPRVMAILGDGKTKYDNDNDGERQALASCTAKVRRIDITTKMRVTYVKSKFLHVELQYKGYEEWTECFTIANITLPNSPFLGVSAQTGDIYDEHDVIAISTHSAMVSAQPAAEARHAAKSSGITFWSFLKLVFWALVVAVVYAAYQVFYGSKQGRRGMPQWDSKRF
jgi:mannose-binding lectin 2